MKKRWQRLKVALSTSSRFSLQYVPPRFCTFFQQIREASPGNSP
ncbi:Tryptophan aminotransferase-related protein 3 [Bienertia sinuspersici]